MLSKQLKTFIIKKMRKSIQNRNVKKIIDNDSLPKNTCDEVIEYTKSISKSKEQCIESVTLTASQYPSCSSITIKLVDKLSTKLTSTFIVVEGEAKMFKNKKCENSKQDPYFLKVKLIAASPILYQLLESIYYNIRNCVRIPPSLNNISVDDLIEKTLNDGCLFINKMHGAIVEYTIPSGKPIVQLITNDIEQLCKRDKQMAKLVITPIVFYRNGNDVKVTFALKKAIIERDFSANVISITGNCERMYITDNIEDDVVKGLGILDANEEHDDDNESESSLFNV
nr:ssDNA-binding phosphoprotein [Wadden Sea poxvirus]